MLINVLKNGCKVEELQLGKIERIERALALYLVLAWHIAHLMMMGRTCHDLNANLFFDPDEIQVVYLLNKKLAPPAPKLNDVLPMVAWAGGAFGQKGRRQAWRQDHLGRNARCPSFGSHALNATRNGVAVELCITR